MSVLKEDSLLDISIKYGIYPKRKSEGKFNTSQRRFATSEKESTRIQLDSVLGTPLGEIKEAEPHKNKITPKPSESSAHRSECLATRSRPDYKTIRKTRSYRK